MNTFFLRTLLIGTVVVANVWMPASGLAEWTFTRMSVPYAPRGGTVSVHSPDFKSDGNYSVNLNGVGAETIGLEDGVLTFRVPDDAVSGQVILSIEGDSESYAYPSPLTVVRPVEVLMDPSASPNAAEYRFDSVYGPDPDNSSRVMVDVAEPTFLFAVGGNEDPEFLAVVLPEEQRVVVNASTTAASLVFMTGPVFSRNPDLASERLADMNSGEPVQNLAEMIRRSAADGRDYFEDPEFEILLDAAVVREWNRIQTVSGDSDPVESSPHTRQGNGPPDFTLVRDLPGPNTPPDLIEPKALGYRHFRGKTYFGLEMAVRPTDFLFDFKVDGNPLDWIAHLHRLDHAQFEGGFDEVAELEDDFESVYERLPQRVLDVAVIPAKTLADKFKVVDSLVTYFIKGTSRSGLNAAFPDLAAGATGFLVPFPEPGVYVVRAYSGAFFDHQDPLLENLPDGQANAVAAMALNGTMAILESTAMIVDLRKAMSDADFNTLVIGLATDLQKRIAVSILTDEFDGFALLELVQSGSKRLLSGALGKLLKPEDLVRRPLSQLRRLVRFGAGQLDVIARVGSAAKLGGRLLALTNWPTDDRYILAQGVETAVVVVGDPWAPVVEELIPSRAPRGHLVTVRGRNFSSVLDENIVDFRPPNGTDPDAPPVLPATVVHASPNSLTFVVPEGTEDGNLDIRITVRGRAARQAAVETSFQVVGLPVIEAITPNPAQVNQPILIRGKNFYTTRRSLVRVIFGSAPPAIPLQVSEDEILVIGPSTNKSGSEVVVTVSDPQATMVEPQRSNAMEIDLEFGRGEAGARFVITTADDGEAPDREVTLREAMGWASGSLERAPTNSEKRQIFSAFDPPRFGLGWADSIESEVAIHHLGSDQPLLPKLTDYDSLFVNIIEGNGQTGPGLVLENAKSVSVGGVKLRGFAGDGIRLSNAVGCKIGNGTAVWEPGGVGLLVEGNSEANSFEVETVSAAEDGIILDGPGVRFNRFDRAISVSNRGYGLLIKNGATRNYFTGRTFSRFDRNASGGIFVDDGSTGNVFSGVSIVQNEGFGIQVEASHTLLHDLRIQNNVGNGILVAGEDVRDVTISNSLIGGIPFGQQDRRTQLTGIHFADSVSDSTILGNRIGGNALRGVWFEGSGVHHNTIQGGTVGESRDAQENEVDGIVVSDGSHSNVIGTSDQILPLMVKGHKNGAGILLTGRETIHNTVIGVLILPGNKFGIRIEDGAHLNHIGLPGEYVKVIQEINNRRQTTRAFFRGNTIYGCTSAGICIAASPPYTATEFGSPAPADLGNRIQNNYFADNPSSSSRGGTVAYNGEPVNNEVGIRIENGGGGNLIGGTFPNERNIILKSRRAGIIIQNAPLASPALANRIWGNLIAKTLDSNVALSDPLNEPPLDSGIGVFIDDSDYHTLGGVELGEGNRVSETAIGVFVRGSMGVEIVGNQIGDDRKLSGFGAQEDLGGNAIAGLILKESQGCQIRNNSILNNGQLRTTLPAVGGVAVVGGEGNRLEGNKIGVSFDESLNLGNTPNGILIQDAGATIIGGPGLHRMNIICASSGAGVVESGTDTVLSGNHIGILSDGTAVPNGGPGVVIEGLDASIGGPLPVIIDRKQVMLPASTIIAHNRGDGVQLVEADRDSSVAIQDVAIHHNEGRGIDLYRGGNRSIAPPQITAFDPVSGTVRGRAGFDRNTELGLLPVGDEAVVQFFLDQEDEGEVFIGQVKVGPDFTFEYDTLFVNVAPSFKNISAIVTVDGRWSSEFGYLDPEPEPQRATLSLRRRDPQQGIRTISPGADDAAVFPLIASASEAPVRILSVQVAITGSTPSNAAIVAMKLFLDVDDDGKLGADDALLDDLADLVQNPTRAIFEFSDLVVTPGTDQTWLVVVDIAATAEGMIELRILDSESLEAEPASAPGFPVIHMTDFPLVSDTVTIATDNTASAFASWSADAAVFPDDLPEADRLPTANPDGDRFSNYWEFVFNLNPMVSNDSIFTVRQRPDNRMIELEFDLRSDIATPQMEIDISENLASWTDLEVESFTQHTLEPGPAYDRRMIAIPLDTANPYRFFRLIFSAE